MTNHDLSRFYSKVYCDPNTGCFLWFGSVNNVGYGSFSIKVDGKHSMRLAHRLSWEIQRGPIPEGLCVLHRCDTPRCVNPDHLFLGTKLDNNRDASRKGRHGRGTAKISIAQAEMIRKCSEGGVSGRQLAKEFGLSPARISQIINQR